MRRSMGYASKLLIEWSVYYYFTGQVNAMNTMTLRMGEK